MLLVSPAPSLAELIHDLAAEHAALDAIVADVADAGWDVATPAEGWSVRDTISHLAFFDEQATTSMENPDEFRAGLEQVWTDPLTFIDAGPVRGRTLLPSDVLEWWRTARNTCLDAFRAV